MTSPPSYATMSRSSVALLQCRGWHEAVGVEGEEECGESGCRRWNSSTAAGAWTPEWGSHMLSECDQPMNLTRYHNLPHLNLESNTASYHLLPAQGQPLPPLGCDLVIVQRHPQLLWLTSS